MEIGIHDREIEILNSNLEILFWANLVVNLIFSSNFNKYTSFHPQSKIRFEDSNPMRSKLEGYVTWLRLKTKFDLHVDLKLNLLFFLFSLLEDNLLQPALIICKYV